MIHADRADHDIVRMCELLGVSRSGYYKRRDRQAAGPSAQDRRSAELLVKIGRFDADSDGVSGALRITANLHEDGEVVSRKTVAKIMHDNGIHQIIPRPWHPVMTLPGQMPHAIPDRVGRKSDQGALNLIWTSDITYLATG
ncbi:IS3 family transposase [Propionibacterium freudenreichii]|uniref:IS3 family transposase n=1 Tax=Propionibacterium freudenreichii TaxID=1744 RepID=UPI00101EC870|nr:IS3 family transposase [Propionibacterium freudenreichii]MCT2977135.1 hypothetical protein [Propionibacterium freudenreichii]MCT3001392.1 hypothetical protein [Propionibacterium freudenreichii]MDK9351085.1 IS3 family transposase [Propionibacterium freudenreichii]MDK9655718.1 IS3 family transposase [Propionibacterium freudenreichii]MDK9661927.1 IS3 family transposase [Propionibacterium freudenreichii]